MSVLVDAIDDETLRGGTTDVLAAAANESGRHPGPLDLVIRAAHTRARATEHRTRKVIADVHP